MKIRRRAAVALPRTVSHTRVSSEEVQARNERLLAFISEDWRSTDDIARHLGVDNRLIVSAICHLKRSHRIEKKLQRKGFVNKKFYRIKG